MSKLTLKKEKKLNKTETFTVGSSLEARDLSNNWYPARISDVDSKKQRIFIHFDGWNSKFDEWIPMNSDRIRSVQKPGPKSERKFEVGDSVLAFWSTYQKSQAIVEKVLPNGKYKIKFEDGFTKVSAAGKMWPYREELNNVSSDFVPNSIGSKQDRRDRKRKLIVSDLFKKRHKPTDSKDELHRSSSSAVPPATLPPPPPVSPSVPPGSSKTEPPPSSFLPVHVKYQDGTCEVWYKVISQRMGRGKTAGRFNVIIISLAGRKFRSKAEILKYFEDNEITYVPEEVEYSTKLYMIAMNSQSKKERCSDVKPVAEIQQQPTTVTAGPVAAAVPVADQPSATPLDDVVYVAGMEVAMQDGQFICPVDSCSKHFRKENLLQMHMKHYHRDLSKLLDYTPSVTDLAYARHVSSLNSSVSSEGRPSRQSIASVETKPLATASTAGGPPSSTLNSTSVDQVSGSVAPLQTESSASVALSPSPKQPSISVLASPSRVSVENEISTPAEDGELVNDLGGSSSHVVSNNPILNTLLSTAPSNVPARPPWIPSSHDVIEEGLRENTDASQHQFEKLKVYELINCVCQIKEEDGMMIQCEVCLCWQHGHCLGYMQEADVPDAYMCLVCKHPPKARSSLTYLNHQQWLKKGKLPTLESIDGSDKKETVKECEEPIGQQLLKRAFDTSGQLTLISRVLHSLAVKLTIADNKHHHKLWLWVNKWHHALSNNTLPKCEEGADAERKQPEKPIDPLECKINLLEHIEQMQDMVEDRLNQLEIQVDELEKMQQDNEGDIKRLQLHNQDNSAATINMLSRDLRTLRHLSVL